MKNQRELLLISKQKIKDAKDKLYQKLPKELSGEQAINIIKALDEFEKELGLDEK
jgi:hypothetical protein